ncbi:MAG: hypothetical protein ACLFQZ_02615 [Spirochaetaceae bacterium]
MRFPDNHGFLSPLGGLLLSVAILAAGELFLPVASLMAELRQSAGRLEESLRLLRAVGQLAALTEEALEFRGSRRVPGGADLRLRRLTDERYEVTLLVPFPPGRAGRARITFYLRVPRKESR